MSPSWRKLFRSGDVEALQSGLGSGGICRSRVSCIGSEGVCILAVLFRGRFGGVSPPCRVPGDGDFTVYEVVLFFNSSNYIGWLIRNSYIKNISIIC